MSIILMSFGREHISGNTRLKVPRYYRDKKQSIYFPGSGKILTGKEL